MKHEGYNLTTGNPSYNYEYSDEYSGKELQKETGWSNFGARMHMSDIARWGVIDPLAETSRRFTPYNYAYNNPISFVDPDGRKAMAVDEGWSWNVPTGSGWFGAGREIRKFGSFEEFVEITSGNEREKGGGGGSEDRTPKRNGDPNSNIFRSIGNFFNRLFGKAKKDAQFSTVLPGAAISRAWTITEFTLIPEGAAPALEGLGTGIVSTAGLTVGAIFIPTMIGEPEFNWTRQFDVPIDLPITTTDSEPEQTMTLFRGVHGKHPDLANAYMGMAIPWGGFATAKQHNAGDNNSMFTSWSTSIDVANYSASRRGLGGIILKQSFPVSRLSFFDRHGEGEVQVFGPAFGAQKIAPWKGGKWTPYLK